jgi:hypothetical protein
MFFPARSKTRAADQEVTCQVERQLEREVQPGQQRDEKDGRAGQEPGEGAARRFFI